MSNDHGHAVTSAGAGPGSGARSSSRRGEIEQALAERQRRISARVDAVQAYVPTGSGAWSSTLRRLKVRRVLPFLAAAGMFLVVRGLRSRRWTPYEEGLDHVSERLATSIKEHLERGEDASDAVKAALDMHPPILELKQSRGLIGIVAHHFSHSVSSAISRELVHRVAALLDRKR